MLIPFFTVFMFDGLYISPRWFLSSKWFIHIKSPVKKYIFHGNESINSEVINNLAAKFSWHPV